MDEQTNNINRPLISVVICTYNNAPSLELTLGQLTAQQTTCRNNFEVILVNNNSSDRTAEICEAFVQQTNLPARYFLEPRQGLSHARNTGVQSSSGVYILFTDDDADLPIDWLESYQTIINKHQPDCLYSKIDIIWDQPPPWWFLPEYNPCFVHLDYGSKLLHVNDLHKEFYGKNFSVKKELIEKMGGFDPALGRNGGKLIAGEETLLYRKLIEMKKIVIYFPNAAVGHRLKDREYTEENIRKQFIDSAYSIHHISQLVARKRILGRPFRAIVDNLCMIASSSISYLISALQSNRSYKLYHKLCLLRSLTYIKLWVSAK
jgi:glycosyltransferase involved in cell wall biosynthesis